ncbi:MAG: DNA repair protein RadC [Tannerella sp.]|jgi:DNA repair protein RadC|nr:DNA repair protein RadC [Tannerella sp.]
MTAIKEWAEDDRPREKMLHKGVFVLSDAELLAIVIGSGNNKESALQLAQRILASVGNSLDALGKRSLRELMEGFHGIGEAKAVSIAAALELGRRRAADEGSRLDAITCSRDIFRLFSPLLADLPHEELWIALTNQAGKLLDKIKISQGGVATTAADLRLILRPALRALATGIVLCHNHPSGSPRPSQEDDKLTLRVQEAARLMGFRLLDHLILAGKAYFSYADEGRLS